MAGRGGGSKSAKPGRQDEREVNARLIAGSITPRHIAVNPPGSSGGRGYSRRAALVVFGKRDAVQSDIEQIVLTTFFFKAIG
jgi:hypothetical protein